MVATAAPAVNRSRADGPGRAFSWGAARLGPVEAFVALQLLCQLLLLVPGVGPLRVLVRSAAFGSSLLLLFVLRRRNRPYPAARWAGWCLLILGLSVLNPGTNSFGSAVAQVAMYLAILAPLWWVPRARTSKVALYRVLLLLWLFHGASAAVGVAQVYFPGRFQPQLSSVIDTDPDYVQSLEITLADGRRMLRPMGLTDVPGGAAVGGFYSALLGVVFLAHGGGARVGHRALAIGSIWAGLFCLYVSQVRATLLMTTICIVGMLLLFARRRMVRTGVLVAVLGLSVVGALGWAIAVGGESVTGRLSSLVNDDPGATYYRSRGRFLEHTIQVLLPEYPLGAGPGRWGMMSSYFGDPANRENPPLWVEIQWTGWLLDGGVPLILAYLAAIAVPFRVAYRFTNVLRSDDPLWLIACFLLAYNLGVAALTFSYPVFQSQTGLEFWLLNALLFVVHSRRSAPRPATRPCPPG